MRIGGRAPTLVTPIWKRRSRRGETVDHDAVVVRVPGGIARRGRRVKHDRADARRRIDDDRAADGRSRAGNAARIEHRRVHVAARRAARRLERADEQVLVADGARFGIDELVAVEQHRAVEPAAREQSGAAAESERIEPAGRDERQLLGPNELAGRRGRAMMNVSGLPHELKGCSAEVGRGAVAVRSRPR